jgi:hypothetical protein
LTDNPDLRAEVEAAEKLGISLKRFRGWEPTTTTRYTWDRDNRSEGPDGYTSTVEPEWDEVEQGWMLALSLYRDRRCPGCGGDIDVTTNPENEEQYRHELPLQCFRCVAFAQAHKAYDDQLYPMSLIHLVRQRPKRKRR